MRGKAGHSAMSKGARQHYVIKTTIRYKCWTKMIFVRAHENHLSAGLQRGENLIPRVCAPKNFSSRAARACVSGPLRMHALLTPHASHHPPHTSRSTLASLGLRRVPRTMHLPTHAASASSSAGAACMSRHTINRLGADHIWEDLPGLGK